MLKNTEIAQSLLQQTTKDQKIVIQSYFDIYYKEKVYLKMKTRLYQSFITFQTKNASQVQTHIIRFGHDLLFEMINQLASNEKRWSLSTCYSIRFQNLQKKIEFKFPQEKEHLGMWRDYLATKLNQRGFHEQFYPVRELGQGYFANVYQVRRYQNRQMYAIKAFNKQETYAGTKGKEAVLNQISVMRSINHPNLMKIFGVFQSKNSLYICVQILSGGQLWDKIKYNQKFNNFELRKIMKSILLGLQALHSKGYMHRDLKPQNILFRDEDSLECVIADFGLVENINSSQHLFVRCGTPGYVAPQILSSTKNKVNYSCSCDIYSLGIILYHLIFRKSPFRGINTAQVLVQNKLSKFNFEDSQYLKINSTLLNLVKGLLEKDPSKRLTAQEALNHQFFKNQTTQILQSYEPNVKGIKEMKNNKTPSKECKVRQKKTSLQYQQNKLIEASQKPFAQQIYANFNMKDQIPTCQDEFRSPMISQSKNPLAPKKVPKVKIIDRLKSSNKQNKST